MNLKNAIREAASARQSLEENASPIEAVNTASHKAAKQQSGKAANAESRQNERQTRENEAPDALEAAEAQAEAIEMAALTVRVPKSSRVHWLISAKKQNTTLTAAITQALNERFGEASPD